MSLIAAVVLVVPTLLFLTEILTAFGASGKPSPTRTTSCSSPCWGCPSRTSFSTSTT